jgi:DNA-binding NtrC family response regulator
MPKNYLVVEDDLTLCPLLMRSIRLFEPDAHVSWITSAQDADAMIRRIWPDLVISDVNLPGKTSGLDLWRHSRRHYPEIPFVLMSGMKFEEFEGLVSRTGPEARHPAFLPKPFSPNRLRQLIDRAVPGESQTSHMEVA